VEKESIHTIQGENTLLLGEGFSFFHYIRPQPSNIGGSDIRVPSKIPE